VGDPFAMAITHAHASGMGGMRGAGDLVARMQMSKGMRNEEAKAYVAKKLKVNVEDLTDPVIMNEVRTELGIGVMTPLPGVPKGIEAKFNIAKALDIDINCVKRFLTRTS
jgi:dimethylamine--corrinoid protein Co-methyltransferase